MIILSNNPYDNEIDVRIPAATKRKRTNHPTMGIIMDICPHRGLPILSTIEKSTAAAKIGKWRSTIRNGYILGVNNIKIPDAITVPSERVDFIKDLIHKAAQNEEEIIEEFPAALRYVRTSELLSDKIMEFPAPLPKVHTSEFSTDRIVEYPEPFDAVGSFFVGESDPIDDFASPSSTDFYDPTRIPETEPEQESSVDVQLPAKRPRTQKQPAVPLPERVERAPPRKSGYISKPSNKRIPKRLIQCKNCNTYKKQQIQEVHLIRIREGVPQNWDRGYVHPSCLQNMHR